MTCPGEEDEEEEDVKLLCSDRGNYLLFCAVCAPAKKKKDLRGTGFTEINPLHSCLHRLGSWQSLKIHRPVTSVAALAIRNLPKEFEGTVSRGNEGIRHVNVARPKNSSGRYK